GATQIGGTIEKPLNARWSVLGALGYESLNDMRVDTDRSLTKGHGVNAGVGLKWVGKEGADFGLSLAGGWKWLDTTRNVEVFDPETGKAKHETQYTQAGARVGQTWQHNNLYARIGAN